MSKAQMLEWLRRRLSEAEKSVASRKQMEHTWACGDDRSWKAAGCKMTRDERAEESRRQGRIAEKCHRDVETLKAIIAELIK